MFFSEYPRFLLPVSFGQCSTFIPLLSTGMKVGQSKATIPPSEAKISGLNDFTTI
jgi:hypothetical protein